MPYRPRVYQPVSRIYWTPSHSQGGHVLAIYNKADEKDLPSTRVLFLSRAIVRRQTIPGLYLKGQQIVKCHRAYQVFVLDTGESRSCNVGLTNSSMICGDYQWVTKTSLPIYGFCLEPRQSLQFPSLLAIKKGGGSPKNPAHPGNRQINGHILQAICHCCFSENWKPSPSRHGTSSMSCASGKVYTEKVNRADWSEWNIVHTNEKVVINS